MLDLLSSLQTIQLRDAREEANEQRERVMESSWNVADGRNRLWQAEREITLLRQLLHRTVRHHLSADEATEILTKVEEKLALELQKIPTDCPQCTRKIMQGQKTCTYCSWLMPK